MKTRIKFGLDAEQEKVDTTVEFLREFYVQEKEEEKANWKKGKGEGGGYVRGE